VTRIGPCAVIVVGAVGCAARPLVVAAAGDLQLGGRTRSAQLAPLGALLDGDLRFANLEGPLTARGAEAEEARPSRFAAPPTLARALPLEVVSLANNHALDQGPAGLEDTVRALAVRQIAAATPARDAVLRRGGRTVVLVARALAPDADLDRADELVAAVGRARARGAVLVSLHWGHTGSLLPTPAQRRLAARLVDAGATAVLGHGPHTPQGIERRGRAVIAYSLGNLAFSCRCTDVTDAYVLRFVLQPDGGADQVRALPFSAGLGGAPPARAHDRGLVELLAALSRDLGSTVTVQGEVLAIR
jgi:poly-gamma-glutamate synthesis protein (capsule biosynthesis protein)